MSLNSPFALLAPPFRLLGGQELSFMHPKRRKPKSMKLVTSVATLCLCGCSDPFAAALEDPDESI